MNWTTEAIDELRVLWNEGHSTAKIGSRLGITKNAVVGKAHRLQLPARPSPIRTRLKELKPLPSTLISLSLSTANSNEANEVCKKSAEVLPYSELRVVSSVKDIRLRLLPCCWPLGEPGTANFRFCDKSAMAGRPYCAEHAAVAYVKVRDRRSDVA